VHERTYGLVIIVAAVVCPACGGGGDAGSPVTSSFPVVIDTHPLGICSVTTGDSMKVPALTVHATPEGDPTLGLPVVPTRSYSTELGRRCGRTRVSIGPPGRYVLSGGPKPQSTFSLLRRIWSIPHRQMAVRPGPPLQTRCRPHPQQYLHPLGPVGRDALQGHLVMGCGQG